ncbi:OmpA family protein [Sphingobium sp. PNB]|uniref:helix-hairpin-helix domain-containing protein n=1 Tax=Sphingobium sp. PNB TaxID=863934 RepID=UPI001CA451E9|nr:helix-hairpin-helix domain-containing protein [Sphingobium sp. PNB]MCB4859173.1 OmpA family protein [Sphingobium sp. PNB]
MLDTILNADWWAEAFWAALGGLGVSAVCFAFQPAMRAAERLRRVVNSPPVDQDPEPHKDPSEPTPEKPVQLAAIEGVGAVIAKHLVGNGITSFEDVARLSPAELRLVLAAGGDRFALAEPMSWPLQAHFLATGQFEAFLDLAVALPAGVPRLEHISGIGEAYAAQLREAGISSLETLNKAGPDAAAKATNVEPSEAAAWVGDAAKLLRGDRKLLADVAELKTNGLDLGDRAAGEALSPTEDGEDWATERSQPQGDADPAQGEDVPAAIEPPDASDIRMAGPPAPRGCPQCCGALVSAAVLIVILIAAGTGAIPPKPPEPEPAPPHCPEPRFHQELSADQLFESNADRLQPQAQTMLNNLASTISAKAVMTNELPGALVIIGHADRRRSSRPGGNEQLSLDRAEAVSNYLTKQLNAGNRRWPSEIVFALGKGAKVPHRLTPASCEGTREQLDLCYQSDRRVDVYAFYIDKSEAPGSGQSSAPAIAPSVTASKDSQQKGPKP